MNPPDRRQMLAELRRRNPPLDCPECSGSMVLRYSVKNDGFFYGCVGYPECTATHGAHNESGAPLGFPADKETKQWRIQAHNVFDRLWKGPGPVMGRGQAYAYVAQLLGITKEEMHIARFGIDECKQLIRVLEAHNMAAPQPITSTIGMPMRGVAVPVVEEAEEVPNAFGRVLDI